MSSSSRVDASLFCLWVQSGEMMNRFLVFCSISRSEVWRGLHTTRMGIVMVKSKCDDQCTLQDEPTRRINNGFFEKSFETDKNVTLLFPPSTMTPWRLAIRWYDGWWAISILPFHDNDVVEWIKGLDQRRAPLPWYFPLNTSFTLVIACRLHKQPPPSRRQHTLARSQRMYSTKFDLAVEKRNLVQEPHGILDYSKTACCSQF